MSRQRGKCEEFVLSASKRLKGEEKGKVGNLLGSRVRFLAGTFTIFSVTAKSHFQFFLSPFPSPSFPFPSPFDLSLATFGVCLCFWHKISLTSFESKPALSLCWRLHALVNSYTSKVAIFVNFLLYNALRDFSNRPIGCYTWEPIWQPSRPIHLNVHIEFDPLDQDWSWRVL